MSPRKAVPRSTRQKSTERHYNFRKTVRSPEIKKTPTKTPPELETLGKGSRRSTRKCSIERHYNATKTVRSSKIERTPTKMPPELETLEEEVIAVLEALRSNVPASLPGRDEHIAVINKLLQECIDLRQSCSIYIYGAPGHGKTASVKMIANQPHIRNKMKVAYVDCRKLMTPGEIYKAIVSTLEPKNLKPATQKEIIELIGRGRKPTLLILDEIDRLKTQTNSVLYSLLELRSTVPAGKIAIIGVGNAQNFIDTLPLMKNNDALEPTLIEFGSYTKEDFKNILQERLNSVSTKRVIFTEAAIELLAAKADVFGDARITLGLATALVQSLFDKSDGEDFCKIDPMSVLSAFNLAFGVEKKTEGKDAVDSLTIPQKLIICSIVLALNKKVCAFKDLTLTHVFSQYKEISAKKFVDVLPQSEFLYACRMLEQQGFFNRKKISKKTISWDDKVLLKWDATKLLDILKTKPMLSDIFNG